jgi:hypothetical protein
MESTFQLVKNLHNFLLAVRCLFSLVSGVVVGLCNNPLSMNVARI